MEDNSNIKLCFDVNLIGSSTIKIRPVVVDHKIWEFPDKVFFICNNGYKFEKSDEMKYSIYRLMMPYKVGDKEREMSCTYTFTDDETRYKFLKKLRDDLVEFTKSGFFGYNPTARVLPYADKWFVY